MEPAEKHAGYPPAKHKLARVPESDKIPSQT